MCIYLHNFLNYVIRTKSQVAHTYLNKIFYFITNQHIREKSMKMTLIKKRLTCH